MVGRQACEVNAAPLWASAGSAMFGPMSPTDWRTRLVASPELFPLTLDPATDRVGFVRLAPVDYEKASFLDERLAAPAAGELSFPELAAASEGAPIACDWIFQTGHVGSTLLSRLLGIHPRVFSLREPQVLRTLAMAEAAGRPWTAEALDARLAAFQALFSRTWATPKRALVKATSLVTGLAPRILAQNGEARALLMTVAPETYLATILSGANLGDVRQAAPIRLARLNARAADGGWILDALSPGELAAMSWASDMAIFAELAPAAPGRTLFVDFEAFLADPAAGVAAALSHLHGAADPAEAAAIAASPYLQRYSKAPEYGYGPELRRQVLAEARAQGGEEIARGMAWLEVAATDWPELSAFVS